MENKRGAVANKRNQKKDEQAARLNCDKRSSNVMTVSGMGVLWNNRLHYYPQAGNQFTYNWSVGNLMPGPNSVTISYRTAFPKRTDSHGSRSSSRMAQNGGFLFKSFRGNSMILLRSATCFTRQRRG